MTTPEDLAKAREILGNLCHCVPASKQLRVVACTYCVKRMQVATAIAEARTTPKPAAEVVEALEALLSECESSYNKDMECVTDDYETLFGKVTKGAINKARAALAKGET